MLLDLLKNFLEDDKLDIKKICVNEKRSIKETMQIIDRGALGIAFVLNNHDKLVGVITDGDIRGAILRGIKLEEPAKNIMNVSPIVVKKNWSKTKILDFLKGNVHHQMPRYGVMRIPVLDENDHVIDVIFISEKELKSDKTGLVEKEVKVKPVNKVLVVGGAGYLGSILCRKLLDRGYNVRVLDNLLYGDHGISDLYDNKKFEFINGDMRNIQTVVDAIKDVDAVIHLAAIVGDPASALDPQETIEINYLGTKMLAEVCKYGQINRFIFASTCSVYGASPTPETKISENSQLNPVSLYAEMKLKSEQGILELIDDNFSPTILRMATLYGLSQRMRFDLVVNTLTIKALKERNITIFGGDQWRPNLHVSDAADAYIKCLEVPINKIRGEVINVGSDKENYQIIEIGKKIKSLVPESEITVDKKMADKRNYNVSFEKIEKLLNYKTKYSIEDGIKEIKNAVKTGEIKDYTDPRYSNYKYLKGQ